MKTRVAIIARSSGLLNRIACCGIETGMILERPDCEHRRIRAGVLNRPPVDLRRAQWRRQSALARDGAVPRRRGDPS